MPHSQFDSSLHVSDSRSNGHFDHEDSLAVRIFRLHDVHLDLVLHLLAQRDVL